MNWAVWPSVGYIADRDPEMPDAITLSGFGLYAERYYMPKGKSKSIPQVKLMRR